MKPDLGARLLGGRYRLIRRLGSGGMGAVFLADDERLGRQVAIKRLHAESPEETARRFEREARLGARLNHPNLVAVYDSLSDDEDVLIVMEYVEGRTLADELRDGPLTPERALDVLGGVAGALDHAHSQGVTHRDVKPANILLGSEGAVKLADLGIATAAEQTHITRTGTALGSPSYMAPEQLEGVAAGPAADVYALAAVAFEVLGGRKARPGRTPLEIAHRVVSDPPPDLREAWPDAPLEAVDVLRAGMSREPADRPPGCGALVRELGEAIRRADVTQATQPIVLPPPPGGEPGSPPAPFTAGMVRDLPPVEPRNATPEPGWQSPAPRDASPAGGPHAQSPSRYPLVGSEPGAATPREAWSAGSPPPRATAGNAGGRTGDPPSPEPPRASPSPARRPSRVLAVLALVAALLAGGGIAAVALTGGGAESSRDTASGDDSTRERRAARTDQADTSTESSTEAAPDTTEPPATQPTTTEESTTEESTTAPSTSTEAETPEVAPDAGRARQLTDQGYSLSQAGQDEQAVPVLRQALASWPEGSEGEIYYSYTLFNLAHALRKTGGAEEAVPLLERRLELTSNQRGTVQRELELARAGSTE